MKPVIDLSDIEKALEDPNVKDAAELAFTYGKATRRHFRGRLLNPRTVIESATTIIQASLRDLPDDERDDTLDEVVLQLETMLDLMRGVLKPSEGEA